MRFVFGYAIPSEAYDYIFRKRQTLVNGNVEFVGRSIGRSGSALGSGSADFFLKHFKEHAIQNRGDKGREIGFAVIYVRSGQQSVAAFEDEFFPSTLTVPVDWRLGGYGPQEVNRSCNELFRLLLQTTIRTRTAITALRKEVVERASRTPLLLPQRNFHSKTLLAWMRELQTTVVSQQCVSSADSHIKAAVRHFETNHPLIMVEDSKRRQPCFLDDHAVEFHTPGKALHGMPHAAEEHPVSCILGGYRRLGAPFNPSFHYDCVKGVRGNLKGMFYRCHESEAKWMEGNRHINIAPNDFTRI